MEGLLQQLQQHWTAIQQAGSLQEALADPLAKGAVAAVLALLLLLLVFKPSGSKSDQGNGGDAGAMRGPRWRPITS